MRGKDKDNKGIIPVEKVPYNALVNRHKRVSKVLPPGYSWLSVPLPTDTLNNLKIQALLSKMSLREYLERFCKEAFPYNASTGSKAEALEQASIVTE
jgi:hypothetical protein